MEPVELLFKLTATGQDALGQIANVVKSIGTSTSATSGQLKIFEAVLQDCISKGNSLNQALKAASASENEIGKEVAKAAKEFAGQAEASERAAARAVAAAEKKAIAEESSWRRIQGAHESALKEEQRRSTQQITGAQRTASAVERALTGGFTSVSGAARTAAASLGVAGIAIASVLAVATLGGKALYDLATSQAAAAHDTANLASRLGLTGGQAARLSVEARLAGVNIGSLQSAVRTLSAALEDPILSGARPAKGLRDIGVAIYDAAGNEREMGQVTEDVIEHLSRLDDAGKRAFESQRILGRGGAKELTPLIEQHQALQRELEAVGVHYDDDLIQKLKDADVQIQAAHASWDLFKAKLAEVIAPIVVPILWDIVGGNTPGPRALAGDGKPITLADASYHRAGGQGPHAPPPRGGSEAASDVLAFLSNADNSDRKKSSQITDDYVKHFNTTLAGLAKQLKEAEEDLRTHQSKLLSGNLDATHAAQESAGARSDEAKIARLQEQMRNTRGERGQGNSAEALLNELNERGFKNQFPSSLYGRVPDLMAQRQQFNYRIGHDEGLNSTQKQNFSRRYDSDKGGYNDQVLQAIKEFLDKQSDKTYSDQKVKTDAKLEGAQRDFATAQRITQINNGRDETPEQIEAAYQRQLDLLGQIKAAHESDLSLLKGETNEVRRRNEQDEIGKNYASGSAQAASERAIALAELRKHQSDAKQHADTEIGKLSDNASVDAIRQSFGKQQRIALLQNDGKESPELVLQSLNAQLQIAQAIYDIHVHDNSSIKDANDQRLENAKAFDALTRETNSARLDAEMRILELQKESLDKAKRSADEIFDAMLKGGNSLQQFFKGQAEQIGKNAFEAAVAPAIQQLGSLAGGNARQMSYLFKGTMLEGDKAAGPSRATDANTKSTDLNTQATYMLYQQLGGTGTVPGVTGASVTTPTVPGAYTLSTAERAIGTLSGAPSAAGSPGMPGGSQGGVGTLGGSAASLASGGPQATLQSALALALGVGAATATAFAPVLSGPLSQPQLRVPSSTTNTGFGGNAGNPRYNNDVNLQRALTLGLGAGLPVLSALAPAFRGSSSSGDGSASGPTGLAGFMSGGSLAGAGSWNVLFHGGAPTFNPATGQDSGGPTYSTSQRVGAGVSDAAMAGAGIYEAVNQFSKGGARGILGGVGATASTAAVFDPEPISKAILSAVGIGANVFKSLLGDPVQARQVQMRNQAEIDQYMAPATINRTLGTDGTENALDAYGRVKSTSFSSIQVQSPYQYKNPDTGALEVMPGQVVEPYSDVPQQPNYISRYSGNSPSGLVVNMPISAMDSQDVMRRSGDITAAVQKSMLGGHPINNLVQRVARNQ